MSVIKNYHGFEVGDVVMRMEAEHCGMSSCDEGTITELRVNEFKLLEFPGSTRDTGWHASMHFKLVKRAVALLPNMILSTDAAERKGTPITTGVLDYFPLAIAAVAQCSKAGNDQHNPGQPLHWAKEKSSDHADCIARHLIDRGNFDTDGTRHSAKLAWRALALLQLELEKQNAA